MIASKEAKKALDLESILAYRQRTRIFGNIDNNIRRLTTTEIVSLSLDLHFRHRISQIFDRDDFFFNRLSK
jgi:hypothetical protein